MRFEMFVFVRSLVDGAQAQIITSKTISGAPASSGANGADQLSVELVPIHCACFERDTGSDDPALFSDGLDGGKDELFSERGSRLAKVMLCREISELNLGIHASRERS